MEIIDQLGVALGLASLAGINLYLTAGVAGLAIHFHWIKLDQSYQGLEILADPVLMGIAWTFFFIEFFADKVPWVDSGWDALQTFIRPVGATLLGLAALGTLDPSIAWAGALFCGGAALTTHLGKAGLRLASNLNPEPTTNTASSIAASTAEDGLVLGGLAITAFAPWLALILAVILIVISFVLAQKSFGLFRAGWQRFISRKREA